MGLREWIAAAAMLTAGACHATPAAENGTGESLDCPYGSEEVGNGSVLGNGTLVTPGGAAYPRGTWRSSGGALLACRCVARPCFRKCCPEGTAANSTNFRCVNVSGEFGDARETRPAVYRERGLVRLMAENEISSFDEQFDVIYGYPCEKPWLIPEDYEMQHFYLFEDGRLAAWYGESILNVSEYCYATLFEDEMLLPVICDKVNNEEESNIKYIVYATAMLISTPFLGATFVVYALVRKLHNTHGRCIMSHVLVLFFGYIFLAVVGLHTGIGNVACMVLAFIIYFAFLASFFWLNVMCLDIWWTFSGFRPMRGSVKEREHKKFIIYSLYCWGSPLIMLIICMVMEFHPDIPDSYEKPGFGELKCWFRTSMGNFIYFSGPIAILIICNIVLFILTAIKIRQVKRGTKILKKQDSRRHNEEEENNNQRFNLYLKLFLVMGVNWIMEIVSFAAGGPDEYWYITDIANTLQGVLIFIIFVWKDRIRKLLIERFCPGRLANTNSLGNSSSTRTTGIRHNGSVMSSGRPSFRNNKDDHQMKTLTSPSARSDDSDAP